MRVLLVDNYDSYTYNLYQLIAQVNHGSPPLVVRNDCAPTYAQLLRDCSGDDAASAAAFDAVVLSPGPGRPDTARDFGVCRSVIEACAARGTPVLGVCLGHQGIAQVYGGVLDHGWRPVHGETSKVRHTGESIFAGVPQLFHAVRYHALVIRWRGERGGAGAADGACDAADACTTRLPAALQALAWSAGNGEPPALMAFRHRRHELYGVQFHIESVCTEYGERILRNFFRAARASSSPRLSARVPLPLSSPPPSSSSRRQQRAHAPGRGNAAGRILYERIAAEQLRCTPERAFRRLYGGGAEPAESDASERKTFWLDSCYDERDDRLNQSRWSYMGAGEAAVTSIDACGDEGEDEEKEEHGDGACRDESSFFSRLQRVLDKHRAAVASGDDCDDLPPFRCGLIGYIGYEMMTQCFDAPRRTRRDKHRLAYNCAEMILARRIIAFDHWRGGAVLLAYVENDAQVPPAREWMRCVRAALGDDAAEDDAQQLRGDAASVQQNGRVHEHERRRHRRLEFRLERPRDEYLGDIRRCLQKIRDGETYEVCLTNRIRATLEPDGDADATRRFDPLEHFAALRRINPAPYAAYLRFAPDFAVCCSSPESYLHLTAGAGAGATGTIDSKPIKGTLPRGASPSEDEALRARLASSRKDRAENLMIVDLVRNDFGRVCRFGSVHVPKLMAVESYASVHQLVSTVRGELAPGRSVVDALAASFPMGSMTGAPKQRTMEIIDALERTPRGVYSGTIGYFSLDGRAADLNVVIRTAAWTRGRRGDGDDARAHARGAEAAAAVAAAAPWQVCIGAGGAIVALSDADEEYEEMVLKGKALMRSVAMAVGAAAVDSRPKADGWRASYSLFEHHDDDDDDGDDAGGGDGAREQSI